MSGTAYSTAGLFSWSENGTVFSPVFDEASLRFAVWSCICFWSYHVRVPLANSVRTHKPQLICSK